MSLLSPEHLRLLRLLFGLVLLLLVASCANPADLKAALSPESVPSGFSDTLVRSVPQPTALAFTPDGRMLITSQSGKLYVLKNGNLTLARTIRGICSNSERGLLGVAVDPAFSQNRYIYLYYTGNPSGVCSQNSPESPVNRVARFVLPDSNIISPAGPYVVLDNIPSPNGNHNGGDLNFGKDGLLYVSVGDGGCDPAGDSGCGAANNAAKALNLTSGKILRVTRTGAAPPGNPFVGANSVPCRLSGRAGAGKVCAEIFALGLRNPYRIAFNPNVSTIQFAINDVGQNAREEIDLGAAGANYGWNTREGSCQTGSSSGCGTPPAGLTDPIFDYGRSSEGTFAGCRSISGGAYVPRDVWPASYGNTYLFADFVCGKIFQMRRIGEKRVASTFASSVGNIVHLAFGRYNGVKTLYYTTYSNGGQVRRISYSGN